MNFFYGKPANENQTAPAHTFRIILNKEINQKFENVV